MFSRNLFATLALGFAAAASATVPTPKCLDPHSILGIIFKDKDCKPTVTAPEIDPASAFTGLTLLMGGLAVVRGRRSKKS